MIYKKFQDLELSALGQGAMRLPTINGQEGCIDEVATREMVDYAMKNGINYYDTAYGYHNGQSEIVMGKILKGYPRESFYLDSKFPGYDPTNIPKGQEIFEEQLKKCQVDYFDFYLFHNVNGVNIDPYLDDESNGLYSYLMEQKKNGRIRHLGFSVHGDYDITKRFLEAYGKDIEFCQIQFNWIDYDYQEAKRKIELLGEYNIPVWVMEPLRGGKLATLQDVYADKLKAMRPEETVPGWAFRFLQTIPTVCVTLSGMSNFEQLKQNIATFQTEEPLSEAEWNGLMEVKSEMFNEKTLPCTSCRYCTSYCPQGLDIPALISVYNDQSLTSGDLAVPAWLLAPIPEEKWPSACVGCRSCEKVCPQEIKISEMMTAFAAAIQK
ncbi:MAG: aldo/keto reductase [Lachnospiraceae bacterium]|nr:aldo/keto reductase [Lachnospiraceae bacterium]